MQRYQWSRERTVSSPGQHRCASGEETLTPPSRVVYSCVDHLEQRGWIIFEERMPTPNLDELTSCCAKRLPAFHARPVAFGVITSVDGSDRHANSCLMPVSPEFGQPDLVPHSWQYEPQYALVLKNLVGGAALPQGLDEIGVWQVVNVLAGLGSIRATAGRDEQPPRLRVPERDSDVRELIGQPAAEAMTVECVRFAHIAVEAVQEIRE